MFHIRLCLFVYVNLFLYAKCSIPVERLCVNQDCKEKISEARGLVNYPSQGSGTLSFNLGQEIIITSKSKNKNDYWGAVINGKSGYVPSNLIQELKVFHEEAKLVSVPVELSTVSALNKPKINEKETVNEQIPKKLDQSQKSSLSKPVVDVQNNLDKSNTIEKPIEPDNTFKIIEGTTIYAYETDEITPSATVDIKSTATHVNEKIRKGGSEERATIPPEILKQNGGYKENGSNFTIKSVNVDDENTKIESEDVDEDESDDDEEEIDDDEDDEEEEDEENINIVNQESIKKSEFEVESKPTKKEAIASSSQSGSLGVENKTTETVVVENSVTSQVSVSDAKTHTTSSPEKETPHAAASSWSMLNGYRQPEIDLNVPSQQAGSIDIKNAVPQTVMSGFDPATKIQLEKEAIKAEDIPNGMIQSKSEATVAQDGSKGISLLKSEAVKAEDIPNGMIQSKIEATIAQGSSIGVTQSKGETTTAQGSIGVSKLKNEATTAQDSSKGVSKLKSEAVQAEDVPNGMIQSKYEATMAQGSSIGVTQSKSEANVAQGSSIGISQFKSEAVQAENIPNGMIQSKNEATVAQDFSIGVTQSKSEATTAQGSSIAVSQFKSEAVQAENIPNGMIQSKNEATVAQDSSIGVTQSKIETPIPQDTSSGIPQPNSEAVKIEKLQADASTPTVEDLGAPESAIGSSATTNEIKIENEQVAQQTEVNVSAAAPSSNSFLSDAITTETIAPETSTLFNQFSVSADTLPDTQQQEVIQKVEVMTEAFATTPKQIPMPTEQFSEPDQPMVPDLMPDLPEEVEETTEAPSVESSPTITEDVTLRDESLPEKAEEPGVMSQLTEMFSGLFSSQTKEVPVESGFSPEYQRVNEAPSGTCQNPDFGSDCKDFVFPEEQTSSWSWPFGLELNGVLTQSNTFMYLVVTAVTVLLFTLGHNLIEKRGKTGPLIAKINKLEKELLVSSKECFLLKDEIQNAKEKINLYENSANDELVVTLQAELEESKKIRSELESSIEILQQELDAATEAGLDLNKMLSEVLTQKGGSESLLKSVESLQAQLDSQQKVIDEMTKKLGVKNEENEALQSELDTANERAENLEEQLSDIKHNLNLHLKEKEDLTRDLNSQISQLKTKINQVGETKEKEIKKLKKELEEKMKKLTETSNGLTVKEEEVKALKESMKNLKTKGDIKMETVFDVSRVQAELAKEVKENSSLLEKLQMEESGKKALAEQVKALNDEMQKLKKGFEEAEQRKDEAEKKLEVLSTYFKEKETQLQKELGLQEALWAQKKGDEKAVYNMMKSLQEEVESYKSQNETLKQEILDQERGLKNQMATFEQKAYENWVAARQAERKLEETKQEMAQLRNRLTLVEKNSNNVDGKGIIRSEELNGVEAASPILHDTSSPLLFPPLPLDPNNSNLLPPGFMPPPMFMPPPIGGFMPPPPFLPGDRRPPPLGRMSSPPLNNRFSPSSPPDYPFERMPSPPLSPNYRYKD